MANFNQISPGVPYQMSTTSARTLNQQSNKEALIESIKDGKKISKDIQSYGITNEADLIEIAKLEAAHDGWELSRYIQN